MARVHVEILRGPYQPALAGGFQLESCRLLTDFCLRGASGWTPFRPGVIDTGAPLSLFPRRVWQAADFRSLGRIRVGGIMRRPECMFDATLAVVTLAIRDRLHQLGPVEAHAVLADGDDVPTLIGMRGVLMQFVLHSNVAAGQAYLESSP